MSFEPSHIGVGSACPQRTYSYLHDLGASLLGSRVVRTDAYMVARTSCYARCVAQELGLDASQL